MSEKKQYKVSWFEEKTISVRAYTFVLADTKEEAISLGKRKVRAAYYSPSSMKAVEQKAKRP